MKKVLYVIIGLALVYVLMCLFGPSEMTVTRDISINASTDVVKMQLADVRFFQEKWSPWSEKDPNMKVTYIGEIGKPGYGYEWEGNSDVGKGKIEFEAINGDSLIQKLTFDGMGVSKGFYVVTGDANATKVIWGLHFDVDFFGRGMMLVMNMDKMMGKDFEYGLTRLKKEIEALPKAPVAAQYEVKEVDWTEKMFVGKRGTFKFEQLSAFFGENYPKLFEELGKAKIEPTMAPTAIYFEWDEKNGAADCAATACVPVNSKIKGWETFMVPASKVLHIAYYGAWNKSINAHLAMDEHMKRNGLPMQTHVIEEYVTDPMVEKDTAKWLTNIYYVLPASK